MEATTDEDCFSLPSSPHLMVCILKLILLSFMISFKFGILNVASLSLSICYFSVILTSRLNSPGICFLEYKVAAFGFSSKSSVIVRNANISLSGICL